uniref:Putative zinc-finger domain-containing protein n=1 Tax=Panagrolaimus sp. ES5 TaxID=591445 RepID=A0AC34FGG8_9BILA
MSDREEGELDSGEEERRSSPATLSKAAKTSDRSDVSSNVSSGKKDRATVVEDMHSGRMREDERREPTDNYRKPRRPSKSHANAFNQISNSKQKFVSRRVNESRFNSSPPPPSSNRNIFDAPPLNQMFTTTNSNEFSPPKPSDSWRQDPVPLNIFSTISPRRPLLPNPFASQISPQFSSNRPAFFNVSHIRGNSYAPPPYRPTIPTAFGFSHPLPEAQYFIPRQNAGLDARLSVDMEISPVNSPLMTENCVLIVDEPLEESDDSQPPTSAAPESLRVPCNTCTLNTVNPPIPYVREPGLYHIPIDATPSTQTERRPTVVQAEVQRSTINGTEKQLSLENPQQKLQKRFSKDFLQHMQSVLLDNLLDGSSSSSSSSEFEEETKEIDNLRRKLVHHNKEMHDELDKRERLVKDMETCQLMINHHYERMNDIMRSISDASRQNIRHARKSLSRTRSEGRKRRKKLCENFESRVSAILDELSAMNNEIKTPPQEIITPERPDETSGLAEILGNLMEDSGVEFIHTTEDSPMDNIETPRSKGKRTVVDKEFEDEYLRMMLKARYGIKPLPHVVVAEPVHPPAKKPPKKKNSDASDNVNLEMEEALRRKLLEQMKKKEQLFPSLHDRSNDVTNEKASNNSTEKSVVGEVMVEIENPVLQTLKPINATVPLLKPVDIVTVFAVEPVDVPTVPSSEKNDVVPSKKVADIATVHALKSLVDIVPVVSESVEEKPKIVPTMKDIIELKRELKIALSKRRKSVNKRDPKVAASSEKVSLAKQNSVAANSSKSSTSVKFTTPTLKPAEKENVGNIGVNPLKRPAPPLENIHPSKKARSLPEEKSKCLDEFERRSQELLFDSPRIAVRNFILSSEYPVKESIERLRHKHDADAELCYFEIFGVCLDDECPYQHQRDFTLNDEQILEEILGYIPERSSRPESIQQQARKLLESNSLEEIIVGLRKETSHLDLIKLAIESSV